MSAVTSRLICSVAVFFTIGLTTVMLNPDGGGPTDLRAQRAGFEQRGVGVNVALYVPHGSIRRDVIGMEDRAPSSDELAKMTTLARNGMEAGDLEPHQLAEGMEYVLVNGVVAKDADA